MAGLQDKIQKGLDETRMLILAGQVLVGAEFRAVFESGFDNLPLSSQRLLMVGLSLLLLALALLLTPGSFHRLSERGEDTPAMHRALSAVMLPVPFPFAAGLGILVYVASAELLSFGTAVGLGLLAFLTAIFFFYLVELVQRRRRAFIIQREAGMPEQDHESTDLKTKIQQLLTEARVALPGAQALFGFQFTIFLTEAFERLPRTSKLLHLGSFGLVGFAIILLLTPAAYHRMVERGEETEHFHRLGSQLLVAALIPLGLGASTDFYVVLLKVLHSQALAIGGAGLALATMFGLWFGLTLIHRMRREPPPPRVRGTVRAHS
jgi:hypothetical protein